MPKATLANNDTCTVESNDPDPNILSVFNNSFFVTKLCLYRAWIYNENFEQKWK